MSDHIKRTEVQREIYEKNAGERIISPRTCCRWEWHESHKIQKGASSICGLGFDQEVREQNPQTNAWNMCLR